MAVRTNWGQRIGALGVVALLALVEPTIALAEEAVPTPDPVVTATDSPENPESATPEPTQQPVDDAVEPSPSASASPSPSAMESASPSPDPAAATSAEPSATVSPTAEPQTLSRTSTVRSLAVALPAGEPVTPPTLTHAADATSVIGTDAFVRGVISEPGARVSTQVLIGNSWSTSQQVTADSAGAYRLTLTYGSAAPGTVTYRVVGQGTGGVVVGEPFDVTRTPWTVGSAASKMIGHNTYTWSTHSGIANRQAWTEVLIGSSWSRSQQGVASSAGQITLPLTYGSTREGAVTFRVRAYSPYGILTSSPFTLNRVPWEVGHAGSKPVNQLTYTWGTMPAAAGRQVSTQVLVNGSWSRSQLTTATATGSFTLPLSYGSTSAGEYTFRVVADSAGGAIASAPFTLERTIDTSSLPTVGRVSSLYGMRVHPITGVYKLHDGHDIAAPCGTPVRSWEDGIVTYAQYHSAYGYFVKVDHGGGFMTGYAHMPRLDVRVGQSVKQAEVIGSVGTTGYSTGCHLHWMAWQDGRTFNPATLY